MKYIAFILAFSFSTFSFGQATRFVYQANFRPDSTTTDQYKTERLYLDIDDTRSFFYSENAYKRDSIMTRMRQTQNFDRSVLQDLRSDMDFVIEKNRGLQNLIFKQRIGRNQYTYPEPIPNSWKITSETLKIGAYPCQKAEIQYGGRQWYAWFTQEIPLPEGPYKFGGLPGLIVKMEDSKGDYSFDLMESKKLKLISPPQSRGQDISLSKEGYNDLAKKYAKDPAAFINSPGGRMGGQRNNNQPSNPRKQQEREQRILDDLKSKNNLIELY